MSLAFYHSGGGSAQSVLGGAISSVALAGTEGELFPNPTTAQVATGITHYASIYIKNTGAVTISNVGVYFYSLVTKSNVYVAKAITAGQSIANNTTAPEDALIWTQPKFSYSPLLLGSLAAGASKQLWFKRVTPKNTAGSEQDYIIITGVE